jgi:sugar phosphate isomerase/epimerase
VIDFEAITRAVLTAGYTGDIEVEIFNQDIWDAPAAEVVARTIASFGTSVGVHLPS